MNEIQIKKDAKSGMIGLIVIGIISILVFVCILIFDHNVSDIIMFGMIFALLIVLCIFGFMKFKKQFNNPQVAIPKKIENNINYGSGYLYNTEWNWDIAEANYRIQHNKIDGVLNEQDEETIWKYCCSEISFYLAWLVDNDFLSINGGLDESDIKKLKNREITPYDLFSDIDLKLSEDDINQDGSDKEILKFVDYCLNDGFESVDEFLNKVARKYSSVFTDKYNELERTRFSFVFNWVDYDEFKKILDKEYKLSL